MSNNSDEKAVGQPVGCFGASCDTGAKTVTLRFDTFEQALAYYTTIGPNRSPAADAGGLSAPAEAVQLLGAVFDAWENGDDCYEGGDQDGSYMGKCFQLDDEIFKRCCDLLNRENPPRNAPAYSNDDARILRLQLENLLANPAPLPMMPKDVFDAAAVANREAINKANAALAVVANRVPAVMAGGLPVWRTYAWAALDMRREALCINEDRAAVEAYCEFVKTPTTVIPLVEGNRQPAMGTVGLSEGQFADIDRAVRVLRANGYPGEANDLADVRCSLADRTPASGAVRLPKHAEAMAAVKCEPGAGEASPIDVFVYNQEPSDIHGGQQWRDQLQAALNYAATGEKGGAA